MESLMKGEIQAFLEENNGQRIKYYERDLGTRYGKINDLRIPRDRNNEFQTALFEKYQRNVGIDDLVVSMYSKGISTRKMAEILEELFHNKYSKSTISRITVNADQDLCKIAGLKLIHFIYSFHSLFTPSSLLAVSSSSCPSACMTRPLCL